MLTYYTLHHWGYIVLLILIDIRISYLSLFTLTSFKYFYLLKWGKKFLYGWASLKLAVSLTKSSSYWHFFDDSPIVNIIFHPLDVRVWRETGTEEWAKKKKKKRKPKSYFFLRGQWIFVSLCGNSYRRREYKFPLW